MHTSKAEWKRAELNVFVDALRDIDRGLQQMDFGYASELPEVVLGGWEGTVVFGNVARSREALAAQTGLDEVFGDCAYHRWIEYQLVWVYERTQRLAWA